MWPPQRATVTHLNCGNSITGARDRSPSPQLHGQGSRTTSPHASEAGGRTEDETSLSIPPQPAPPLPNSGNNASILTPSQTLPRHRRPSAESITQLGEGAETSDNGPRQKRQRLELDEELEDVPSPGTSQAAGGNGGKGRKGKKPANPPKQGARRKNATIPRTAPTQPPRQGTGRNTRSSTKPCKPSSQSYPMCCPLLTVTIGRIMALGVGTDTPEEALHMNGPSVEWSECRFLGYCFRTTTITILY